MPNGTLIRVIAAFSFASAYSAFAQVAYVGSSSEYLISTVNETNGRLAKVARAGLYGFSLSVSGDGKLAVVGTFDSNDPELGGVNFVDLAAGVISTPFIAIPYPFYPLISPNGSFVVLYNTTGAYASMGQRERMPKHASGSFAVKIAAAESSAIGKEGGVGRMTIDKIISGDLAGTSKGEMLTGVTESTGAMAYVALETVTATLEGRSGTFVFMHNATMNRNDPQSGKLHVAVVAGSGTGELAGIGGTLAIHVDGAGKHAYTFDYELP